MQGEICRQKVGNDRLITSQHDGQAEGLQSKKEAY